MSLEWLGWNDLSFSEQANVVWYSALFSTIALTLVLVGRAMFGGLLKRTKAWKKRKAKARKKKGRR